MNNPNSFSHASSRIPRGRVRTYRTPAAFCAALGLLPGAALAADSSLAYRADITVKETFDSNVYLQDVGALRSQESFVTSVMPRVGLDYKPCTAFGLSATYAPEVVRYHAESSENYVAHRANLNLAGKIGSTVWEQANSFTWIDGNSLGPTYALPSEVPAVGGIPVRDRRAAVIWRNSFKLTQPVGDRFFLRPVASAYVHDFQTAQFDSAAAATKGYENYIDRQDVNGGLDLGWKVAEKTSLVAGYRFGHQDQFLLRGVDSPYDSSYHRILMGVEGAPADWVKLSVMLGPDLRQFEPNPNPSFRRHELLYWVDAAVTLLPTKQDALTLSCKRYEQPAFSSPSVYEDVTYDATWKRKLSDQLTASAGFRIYIGDWQAPVSREDWIYTPNASLTYTFDKHASAELGYSYDWVESKVPSHAGREYRRHLGSVSVKYAF